MYLAVRVEVEGYSTSSHVARSLAPVQGRFLFRPGPALNDLVLGILGRCQRNYDLTLCAVTALSSHLHLLAVAADARQISNFMRDVKSKLAREVNRLTGWEGHVFQRRYDMAVVTEEEGAQIGRLAYILAHGIIAARRFQWGAFPRLYPSSPASLAGRVL